MTEGSGQHGDWLTLRAAAAAAGISEKSARRRIKDGSWRARRVDSPYGSAWQVWTGAGGSVPTTMDSDDGESPSSVAGTLDGGLTQVLQMLDERDQTIMELAGRVGYYQAENEQLRTTLKALKAPREEPTPIELAVANNPAEEPPRAPWRRLWRWMMATG